MPQLQLVPRSLAGSIDALVAGCTSRRPMVPADSKSGARFEWVERGPVRLVLKYQDARDDWLMRATGDLDGRRYAKLWGSGLLDELPPVIDHAVAGAAVEGTVGAVLLNDVTDTLLPPGDEPLELDQHLRFLDHMAQLHARFWGWRDVVGLTPMAARYLMFSPAVARAEAARGSAALVPKAMSDGWGRFPTVAPRAAAVVLSLLQDSGPLVAALDQVPHTLVHGDWKAANLGTHPDGRTVLLDWGEVPGEASPIADLAWYLALNAARLPQSKEATIASYRGSLESHGIGTASWWDRALKLELLGALVQFGWEKALGGPGPELDWWQDRAVEGASWLR